MFGSINKIRVDAKHWSKDSYPQVGAEPQALLNEQFINDCDAVVAVFWSRFGTPTDKYQSGTEEEIKEMRKKGKQIFLYFSKIPTSLDNVDTAQYETIKAYRKKFEDDKTGLYGSYTSIDEFERLFLNHLTLHFLNIVAGDLQPTTSLMPKLIINGVQDRTPCNKVQVSNHEWTSSEFMKEKKKKIIEMIENVQKIKVSKTTGAEIEPSPQKLTHATNLSEALTQTGKMDLSSIFNVVNAKIEDDDAKQIENFCKTNAVVLPEDFFVLGNLKEQKSLISIPYGNSKPSLIGTDSEK